MLSVYASYTGKHLGHFFSGKDTYATGKHIVKRVKQYC